MKRTFGLLALMATALLAACGGGGGGGGVTPTPIQTIQPKPTPTATPTSTPTKSVTYSWTGALHPSGTTAQSRRREAFGGASPDPVMAEVCDPRANVCNGSYPPGSANSPTINVAESGASPAPSASPTITMPSGLSIAYQAASPPFSYLLNPTTSGAGQYTMNVTFADGTTGTVPLNLYQHVLLGCTNGTMDTQPGGGYSDTLTGGYSFDTNSATTTIAASDVYVTGQNCTGDFADPSAPANGYQIHTPYGSTIIAVTSIDWATISPSLWQNQYTVYPFNSQTPSPTAAGLLVGKTHNGQIFAIFINDEYNGGYDPPYHNGNWFGGAAKVAPVSGNFPY